MGDYIKTEPYALLTGARNDISTLYTLLKDEEIPDGEKAYNICFHIQRAAEKTVKGYIRHKDRNINVRPIHNMDYLYGIVSKLDTAFIAIAKDLDKLDVYTSWVGYEPVIKIDKDEVLEALKSLRNIYTLEPIKEIRKIENKKHKFNYLPDTIIDTLINMAQKNDTLICLKHQIIDKSKYRTFENMKMQKEKSYGKIYSKYIKNMGKIKKHVLARNLPENKVELFIMDRDFNKKQAALFIKNWDKEQKNKKMNKLKPKNAIKMTKKKKIKDSFGGCCES